MLINAKCSCDIPFCIIHNSSTFFKYTKQTHRHPSGRWTLWVDRDGIRPTLSNCNSLKIYSKWYNYVRSNMQNQKIQILMSILVRSSSWWWSPSTWWHLYKGTFQQGLSSTRPTDHFAWRWSAKSGWSRLGFFYSSYLFSRQDHHRELPSKKRNELPERLTRTLRRFVIWSRSPLQLPWPSWRQRLRPRSAPIALASWTWPAPAGDAAEESKTSRSSSALTMTTSCQLTFSTLQPFIRKWLVFILKWWWILFK